ncbi:GxxExxY protein [uncultured Draconibacterium sp.]|uniref:GxxExxY protein n=1 Tax=uncultured Draconibacterium sp. TaxID=1573823 RepID=UPI003261710E
MAEYVPRGTNFSIKEEEIERVAKIIVDCAYKVHKTLGSGLLERVYEVCFCHELDKAGLSFLRQQKVPVVYDGIEFDEGFRLDVMVEDLIICELKSVTEMYSIYTAQILSHMKLMDVELGFLINFNVPLIKNGIKRLRI